MLVNVTRPFGDVPLLSIKNFLIATEDCKKDLMPHLLKCKEDYDNKLTEMGALPASSSFPLLYDKYGIIKELKENYIRLCDYLFGPFTISDTNLCALMTNADYYAFNPHFHKNSTICSVYYLQIPKRDEKYCGKFLVEWEGEWISYQPVPNELIVFPYWLVHDIEPHTSNDWRISINMDITTEENLKTLVNLH